MLPRMSDERKLKIFTMMVGLLLGGLPLLFLLPGLADVYYKGLQRCPRELMPLVQVCALAFLFHPLLMAVRGYLEGKAAHLKQPVSILTGQACYFVALTCTALACLALGIPGNLLPGLAFFAANLAAALTMQMLLTRQQRRPPEAVEAVSSEQ